MKKKSALYPASRLMAVQENIRKYDWAKQQQADAVEKARFWMEKSDDEVWEMMFGHTLRRSYHVWSDGYCPDCGKPMPTKTWLVDAKKHPWKVQCPHCKTLFPKNDFYAFYKSGLDEKGIFRYELADDTLLTYDDTPGDCESIYRGGGAVDDGEGAAPGWFKQGQRWYFIAHYLVEGQWRQLVVGGISSLTSAYLMTGDTAYAHKAAILLDRVADVLPNFSYIRQGLVYERPGDCGYVTTWHDSNVELRSVVLCYDAIFEGIKDDASLVVFLSEKAKKYHNPNPKATFADIQRNIEDRILRDIQNNREKIHCNFPAEETTLSLSGLVLGDEENVRAATEMIGTALVQATSVDGVTGERGIAGYSSITVDYALGLLEILYLYDADAATEFVKTHPQLEQTFRFFTDIYFLDKFYPQVGDTGYFGASVPIFQNVSLFERVGGPIAPTSFPGFNLYTLLWKLYRKTGNAYYRDVVRRIAKHYPVVCDICDDSADEIFAAAADSTPLPTSKSVNLKNWQLAALVSGKGEYERAVWTHYLPVMHIHGHVDTLNLGLYAFGLDLMPDCGYPPIQFGGWHTDKARWYGKIWAHNLVVVDRREDLHYYASEEKGSLRGETKLWYDKDDIHAFSVSAPERMGTSLYERTVCMVDLDEKNSVVFDLFRVRGGKEHIKLMHSGIGTCAAFGFDKKDDLFFPEQLLFGEVKGTAHASESVCGADWTVQDHNGLNENPRDIHLAYYDLTEDRGMYETTMWINAGSTNEAREDSAAVLMTVRTGENLDSCFASVIVPYENENPVKKIEKTAPYTYCLTLTDGETVSASFAFDENDNVTATILKNGEMTYVSNAVS